jgi:hypothetical protein
VSIAEHSAMNTTASPEPNATARRRPIGAPRARARRAAATYQMPAATHPRRGNGERLQRPSIEPGSIGGSEGAAITGPSSHPLCRNGDGAADG